jgi:hypothetical protein
MHRTSPSPSPQCSVAPQPAVLLSSVPSFCFCLKFKFKAQSHKPQATEHGGSGQRAVFGWPRTARRAAGGATNNKGRTTAAALWFIWACGTGGTRYRARSDYPLRPGCIIAPFHSAQVQVLPTILSLYFGAGGHLFLVSSTILELQKQ